MKNLVISVKAIPGTTRNQVIDEAIQLAQEMDTMLEVESEGVKVHVLPNSTIEQVNAHFVEKTGK